MKNETKKSKKNQEEKNIQLKNKLEKDSLLLRKKIFILTQKLRIKTIKLDLLKILSLSDVQFSNPVFFDLANRLSALFHDLFEISSIDQKEKINQSLSQKTEDDENKKQFLVIDDYFDYNKLEEINDFFSEDYEEINNIEEAFFSYDNFLIDEKNDFFLEEEDFFSDDSD